MPAARYVPQLLLDLVRYMARLLYMVSNTLRKASKDVELLSVWSCLWPENSSDHFKQEQFFSLL